MTLTNNIKLIFGGAAVLATLSTSAFAEDISYSLRNSSSNINQDGGYLELGIGAEFSNTAHLTDTKDWSASGHLVLNGRYQWKGLFIEAYGASQDPLTIGYNAINYKNWSFDIVSGPKNTGVSGDLDDRFSGRFSGLDERKLDFMVGGRLTGYYDGAIVQFRVQKDVTNKHGGINATALYGKSWQLKNWNVHGLVGLAYNSKDVNDYYLGVNSQEAARTNFSEYKGKDSVIFTSEIGVTYPVSESWVFRATAKYAHKPKAIDNSPLWAKTQNNEVSLISSITYVF
ncbi:MAG: MipA/OmpV family protein [Psychrobium sp.]|nr:MipA/OmpV family protein [Psychrobium sp.]